MPSDYPRYIYFPRSSPPPDWSRELAKTFADLRPLIDTEAGRKNESNAVLGLLRPALLSIGYHVETKGGEIPRPVLFGEGGTLAKEYKIDAYHPGHKVLLEVEAGRGAKGNAIYRDLIQMSLIVDATHAAIAVPNQYRFNVKGQLMKEPAYSKGYDLLDAIYTSGRLKFPFEGILLIGY